METTPPPIVIFKQTYEETEGRKSKKYYVTESIGTAAGILISAIHQAELLTLTHTSIPLSFLANLLHQPKNENPFLLLPVRFPADDAQVPLLKRKGLNEIMKYY